MIIPHKTIIKILQMSLRRKTIFLSVSFDHKHEILERGLILYNPPIVGSSHVKGPL